MHPLHNEEFLKMLKQLKETEPRRTGRSTAIALRTISEAISKPFQPIQIKDHFGHVKADQHLAYMIMGIINKLDLQFMFIKFEHNGIYLKFGEME